MLKPRAVEQTDGGGVGLKQRGPRADGGRAKTAIRDAARAQFAAHGYQGATMRAIAGAAGVDVALVSYYFGSKNELFVAALELPVNPAEMIDGILAEGAADAGARLLETLLGVWDEPATGAPLISMLRSAPAQADMVREFLEQQLFRRLAAAIDAPDAELRASAVATQVLGLVFVRYVLRAEPIASAAREDLVALFGPTLQRYLTGDAPSA